MALNKDENSVAILGGVSDLDGSVLPIQIDPVSGGILIEVYIVSDGTSVLSAGRAGKDGNSSSTLLGVADDASGLLIPGFDNRNNYLWMDILTE